MSPVGTNSSTTSSSLSSANSSLSSGVNGYNGYFYYKNNNQRVILNGIQSTPKGGLMLENPLVKKPVEENNNINGSNYSSIMSLKNSNSVENF